MKRKKQMLAAALSCGMLLLSACRALPAEKTVVIPENIVSEMKPTSDDQFDLTWLDYAAIRKFHKVKIEAGFADWQLDDSWWDRVNIVHLFYDEQELQQRMIAYVYRSFDDALAESRYWEPAESADSETMILHFTIVQAIPNKPCLGALSNLSSLTPFGAMAIPVKMTLHSLNPSAGGVIAAEVTLMENTGAAFIGAMADRAKAPTAIFSIRAFTPYANIETVIDRWSESIVAGLDCIQEGQEPHFPTNPGFAFIN